MNLSICVLTHWCVLQSGRLLIQMWNSTFTEMGRKASSGTGKFGCLVKMSSHLAVPGTNLQLRGHHSPDANRGQEIWHCGFLLENTYDSGSEFYLLHLTSKKYYHGTLCLCPLKLQVKFKFDILYHCCNLLKLQIWKYGMGKEKVFEILPPWR